MPSLSSIVGFADTISISWYIDKESRDKMMALNFFAISIDN